MTLRRQLIIIIVTLFLLLFAGTFTINVHNTRDYLNSQLHAISQDMATSLGLTLSPHVAEHEMVVVESLVDAVFDSGYYREVLLSDIDGNPLVKRIQPVSIDQVPKWFSNLIPLETPQGEALIMSGWQQAGSIRISANPGFAYATLWSSSVQSFFWFLASSLVVFGLGIFALYYVLRPLRAVESQAKAISNKDYALQTKLPWTLELRSVVEAMNQMTIKIRGIFAEQEAALDRMRGDAYRDETTGLGNRNYFNMQLQYLIESSDNFETGALMFLELSDFKNLNDRLGYQAGDALLRGISELIQIQIKQGAENEGFAARLSGTNIAIVIANITDDDALAFAEILGRLLPTLQQRGLTDTTEIGHIGLAMYRGQGFQQWLSEADMALRAAQVKGKNAIHRHETPAKGELDTLTATQWIAFLRKIVDQRKNTLLLQATLHAGDMSATMHQEVLLRIAGDDGKLIPAGIFIPMVHRHGLTKAFDKMVISEVLDRLSRDGTRTDSIAINLLPASINDPEFIEWVHAKLSAHSTLASRICFEMSDYAVTQNLHAVQAWIRRIAPTGAVMGIDHFGKGFSSINYLSMLKLAYIKIDGSFIRDIDKNRDNQQFVESMVSIAHGQDILAIAESVETAGELEMVMKLRFDGIRGYGVHMPEVWESLDKAFA